jgi:acyl-CoA synthetase (AMP-forming)/AMP-acid ligase II/acyl carrier protein
MSQLEHLFGIPVIEAYGMTEGAHQLSSNPLPPQPRKSGSVGLARGLDIAILDQAGNRLPQGKIGEIAVRGPSLTQGYQENPAANSQAFVHGWFRTGDQGYLDSDNYLFITGRIKEIINRGGEKVAPREVDEVFINHPAVRQATTFAAPHETLGEDVVTAVELHKHQAATAKELRDFAFGQLADFKVPSQVLIVDEIPKGPTGKLRRIGLAGKLADKLQTGYAAPATPTEQALAGIWSEILALDRVGVEDNFFRIGGDSLRASQLIARIQAVFHLKLPIKAPFRAPTIAEQARLIEEILVHEIEALSEEEAKQLVEQSS